MRRTELIESTHEPSVRDAAGAPGWRHCTDPSIFVFKHHSVSCLMSFGLPCSEIPIQVSKNRKGIQEFGAGDGSHSFNQIIPVIMRN